MQKRGMVSPVFKYIMSLIVGVVFLLFLINIGVKYMDRESSFQAYQLTSGFDDVLSALGTSEDSDNTYNFGSKTTLQFTPGEVGKTYFELRSGSSRPIQTYKIIYSPKSLVGNSLIILTKRWYFPFAVDNFFYLSNRNYKYFIVYNDETEDLANELAGPEEEVTPDIPNKFGFELIDGDKIKSKSNLRTLSSTLQNLYPTFILLYDDNSGIIEDLKDINRARVRVIKPSEDDPNYGEVHFEEDSSIIVPYLGRPMMIGSFFSEDSESYQHSLRLALNKLGSNANIYKSKKEIIQGRLISCTPDYLLIGVTLDRLILLARPPDPSAEYPKAEEYKNLIESLEDNNELLGGDCPEIF